MKEGGWWSLATTSPRRETGPGQTARPRWVWWAGWGAVAALSVGIALFSFPPYLPLLPDVEVIPLNPGFPDAHALIIASHAVPAGIALLVGPFQFVAPLRRRYLAAHRWVGRVYLACVAVGSIMGFAAAIVAVTGFMAQAGFVLLVALWLYSGWMAYANIRNGNVGLHRVWMVRNFALTFAAVTLRLVLVAGQALTSLPFEELYHFAIWTSVLGSLVFAEWFVVQRTLQPLARGRGS